MLEFLFRLGRPKTLVLKNHFVNEVGCFSPDPVTYCLILFIANLHAFISAWYISFTLNACVRPYTTVFESCNVSASTT